MIVFISNAAHKAITSHADPKKEWAGGTQLPSGEWIINLSRDTIELLHLASFPGESINDVILRICARPQ